MYLMHWTYKGLCQKSILIQNVASSCWITWAVYVLISCINSMYKCTCRLSCYTNVFFLILGKGARCHSQWEKTWNGNGGKLKTDYLSLFLKEDQGWGYWQWGQGGTEFLLINPDFEVSFWEGLSFIFVLNNFEK